MTINKEDVTYTAGISYDSQVGDHVDTGIALMIPAAAKWRVDKDCHGVETRTGSDVGWRYEDSSLSSDARQIFAPSIAACRSDSAFRWTLPRRDLITGVSERATYSRIISPTFTSWEDEWKIKKTVAADVFVYLSDDDYVRNENTFPAFHENVNPFDSRWNSLSIKWAYTSLTVGYSHKVLRTVEDLNQSVVFLAAGILIGSVNWRRVIQHNPPRPEKRREDLPETVFQ
jgi:hypothetical protein